jgi:diguanylate cyclase (GGDEF)-like protein
MFERIHLKFVAIASRHSKRTFVIIISLILSLLCLLDHITGDYSLTIFYLIPVSLSAWFVGKQAGIFFCMLTLGARFAADYGSSSATRNSSLHHWNLFIEFSFLIIMSLLSSALKTRLDNEKALARIDPLTGAINRRSFFNLAEQEIYRARRYGHCLTIAYIDLDNFKEVNDRQGHSTGDKLLIAVADTINATIRSSDILARFGGDEFVILLPETAGEPAQTTLHKVQSKLRQCMTTGNWPVTFSIGAMSYTRPPESVEEAVRSADALMYEVKRSGKNRLLHITTG